MIQGVLASVGQGLAIHVRVGEGDGARVRVPKLGSYIRGRAKNVIGGVVRREKQSGTHFLTTDRKT